MQRGCIKTSYTFINAWTDSRLSLLIRGLVIVAVFFVSSLIAKLINVTKESIMAMTVNVIFGMEYRAGYFFIIMITVLTIGVSGLSSFTHYFCCGMYCTPNSEVGSAAADIARHSGIDVCIGWVFV